MSTPPRPAEPAAAFAVDAVALRTAARVAPTDWWLSRQPMQVVDTVDQSFLEASSRHYQSRRYWVRRLLMDS